MLPSTDRLYAQNHHGVYRSDDDAENWESIADGLPADFGFVMLTHPRRAGTAWVIPLKADGERIPPDGQTGRPPDRRRRRELEAPGRRPARGRIQRRAPGRRLRRRCGPGRRLLRHPRRQRLRQRRRGGRTSPRWPRTCRTSCACGPPRLRLPSLPARRRPAYGMPEGPVAGISVVLPSVLQPLAGGQSFLTAPADDSGDGGGGAGLGDRGLSGAVEAVAG